MSLCCLKLSLFCGPLHIFKYLYLREYSSTQTLQISILCDYVTFCLVLGYYSLHYMKYTHLFFDMDGTVSLSRTKILPKMKDLLTTILKDRTIVIISGSIESQMSYQMEGVPIIKMCQNGNHVILPEQDELWNEPLTEDEKSEITEHANKILAVCTHEVPNRNDLLEIRGAQISLSLYGHHADPVIKRAFDPDFAKRKALLAQFPFESDKIEVKIGGTTTFDYFPKGKNKGFNINRFITHMNWDKNECLFFGDALFPGGNDETVVGVIETVAVTDPEDTILKLQELL